MNSICRCNKKGTLRKCAFFMEQILLIALNYFLGAAFGAEALIAAATILSPSFLYSTVTIIPAFRSSNESLLALHDLCFSGDHEGLLILRPWQRRCSLPSASILLTSPLNFSIFAGAAGAAGAGAVVAAFRRSCCHGSGNKSYQSKHDH